MSNLIKDKIKKIIIDNNINYDDLSNDELLVYTYYLFIKSDYFQDRNNFFLIKDKFNQYDIINFDMESLYNQNLHVEKSSIVYDEKPTDFINYDEIYFSNNWIDRIKLIKEKFEKSESYKDIVDFFQKEQKLYPYFEYFLNYIIDEENILINFNNVYNSNYSSENNNNILNYDLNIETFLGLNGLRSPFNFKISSLFEKKTNEIIDMVLNPNKRYLSLSPYLENSDTFEFLFRENIDTIDINSDTFKKIKESSFYKHSILSYIIESKDINKNDFINNFVFHKDKKILINKIDKILNFKSDLSLIDKHFDKINPILNELLNHYNNKNTIKLKKIKNLTSLKRDNFLKKFEIFSHKNDTYSILNGNVQKYFSNANCEYFIHNNYEILSSLVTRNFYKNKQLKSVYSLYTNFYFYDDNDINKNIKKSILDIIKNKEKNEVLIFSLSFDDFIKKNQDFFLEISKNNVIIMDKGLFSNKLIKSLENKEITDSLYNELLSKNNICEYILKINADEKNKQLKNLKFGKK